MSKSIYLQMLELGLKHSERLSIVSRISDAVSIVIIPIILTFLGMTWSDGKGTWLWQSMFIAVCLTQLAFYLVKFFKPEVPGDMISLGHKIYMQSEEKTRQIEKLIRKVDYGSTYLSLEDRLTVLAHPNLIKNLYEQQELLKLRMHWMMSLIVLSRHELFNFDSDKWGFRLYVYNKSTDRLVSICGFHDNRHPSFEKNGRQWVPGQGHVGKAFLDKRAIITGNASKDEVWTLIEGPQSPNHTEDREVYKSFASIPVLAPTEDGQDEVAIGVVVATSDKLNRFDKENAVILKMLADKLSVILSMNKMEFSNEKQ